VAHHGIARPCLALYGFLEREKHRWKSAVKLAKWCLPEHGTTPEHNELLQCCVRASGILLLGHQERERTAVAASVQRQRCTAARDASGQRTRPVHPSYSLPARVPDSPAGRARDDLVRGYRTGHRQPAERCKCQAARIARPKMRPRARRRAACLLALTLLALCWGCHASDYRPVRAQGALVRARVHGSSISTHLELLC